MLRLSDPSSVQTVQALPLRQWLAWRFAQLGCDDPITFLVVEPGDSVEAIETGCGWPILGNVFDETRYGHPDFAPSFEFLEEHSACYEMLFVWSDDGAGIVVVVPKAPGVDETLLRFCREFASPVAGAAQD